MLLPLITFDSATLPEANYLLTSWGHAMGPIRRGDQRGWVHVLKHEGRAVGLTVASYLIRERVGGAPHLTRENTVELSRLCAERAGLCRVVLRLWREFVFPSLGFAWAMSYQDHHLHTGNTYRFDGWQKIANTRSGTDSRSGRKGRNKWVWVYQNPRLSTLNSEPSTLI